MTLVGIHEPGGENLIMPYGGGWILHTVAIGHDPKTVTGQNFTNNHNNITRINHGYGETGTIPLPSLYAEFGMACSQFVKKSTGCHIWVIGNEPNHPNEWPDNQMIDRQEYVECYNYCFAAIKIIAPNDIVIPAPMAPWIDLAGDWVEYAQYVWENVIGLNAIAIHTYSRGSDPASITDMSTMDPPYQDRLSGFRTYYDWLEVVPKRYLHLPVYITECNQGDQGWLNENNGWIQAAYNDIKQWNLRSAQQIKALIMYRWPKLDKWYIEDKDQIIFAMREVYDKGDTPMPESNKVRNPYFQGSYGPQDGVPQLQLADQWRAFWVEGRRSGEGYLRRPEYTKARPQPGGHQWEGQQWFVSMGTMKAGIYQWFDLGEFEDTDEKWVLVQAMIACEGHNKQGPGLSDLRVTIGIDRTGNADPNGRTVQWVTPIYQTEITNDNQTWLHVQMYVKHESKTLTVFIEGENQYRYDTSVFVKSVSVTVVDNPWNEGPPTKPPPVDGECQVSQILAALDVQTTVLMSKMNHLTHRGDQIGV